MPEQFGQPSWAVAPPLDAFFKTCQSMLYCSDEVFLTVARRAELALGGRAGLGAPQAEDGPRHVGRKLRVFAEQSPKSVQAVQVVGELVAEEKDSGLARGEFVARTFVVARGHGVVEALEEPPRSERGALAHEVCVRDEPRARLVPEFGEAKVVPHVPEVYAFAPGRESLGVCRQERDFPVWIRLCMYDDGG